MMRFDKVYSIVGDSKLPLLGLVETGLSASYSFFYTKEKSSNIDFLEKYYSKYYPDLSFDFHDIPSINDSLGIINQISNVLKNEIADDIETAVFVTAGTKLMAMSMMFHSNSQSIISCRRGLEFVIDDNPSDTIVVPGKLMLDGILESCGASFVDNTLKLGERNANGISVTYDDHLGQLEFIASIEQSNAEKRIPLLISLSEIFGRSGATYMIKSSDRLKKRAKNLIPKFMKIQED